MDLIVFSDDWGRHPSSCQHLVKRLLPKYQVCWVNTVGTRRLRLDSYTVLRSLEKLRAWVTKESGCAVTSVGGPDVLSPIMWPGFGSRFSRWLNRKLLSAACREISGREAQCTVVTTIPLVADLIGRLPVHRWVYYCVDDLSEWPGLDKSTLIDMERKLVERVDAIVAVSENLVARMASFGHRASLISHGVDLEHWRAKEVSSPAWLQVLPQPYVIFWGVLDKRLNVEWVRELSDHLTSGTIVLVGPENNPDPILRTLQNVVLPGPMDYEELPSVACAASVLIMPYAVTAVTEAMQPLKLKEYLCTGKPVVVTNLPATRGWSDSCDLVSNAEDFVGQVRLRLSAGIPAEQLQSRRRLDGESWEHKATQFETVVFQSED